jgi:hypothetical protein
VLFGADINEGGEGVIPGVEGLTFVRDDCFGISEINQLYVAIFIEHKIHWFQVTMYDILEL